MKSIFLYFNFSAIYSLVIAEEDGDRREFGQDEKMLPCDLV